MPRKPRLNRAYKKGESHRDARLFVIVAEGEREDAYFKCFNALNQRVNIQIIPREQNRSAPKFFLERVEKAIELGGWSPKENDLLWFVLDVDRWSRETIIELRTICEQHSNWFLGISNPCFEVWLLFHLVKTFPDNGETCSNLKQKLHQVSKGGIEIDKLARSISDAANNAANSDDTPTSYFPNRMETKLYVLANQLLKLLGENWS